MKNAIFAGLLVSFTCFHLVSNASGQDAADIDTLKRQYEEQRAEIAKLRDELKRESEARQRQQALLESVLEKLEKLTAALETNPAIDETTAKVVNAVHEPERAEPAKDDKKQTDKPADTVESGLGKVKFNGLLQGWYAGGNGGVPDTFRIRRAELKFSGEIVKDVRWTVMFDLAKALSLHRTSIAGSLTSVNINQNSRIFQEGFITLSHLKNANIQVGQFKAPLSQEGLQSSSTLDTVERALFLTDRSRGGGLGDFREIGIMAFGPLGKQFEYQIGVFNGTGETQNDVDLNEEKAVIGRFIFKPSAIKGLQLGTSGAYAPATGVLNDRHHRLGADAVFQRDKLRLKSEFMTGIDGEVHRRGFYAHAGYRFMPKLEWIVRFDTFDPHTGSENTAATVTERDYVTGFNYYIKENNFKLQFNYIRKTFVDEVRQPRNVFLVNLQTAW